MRIEVKPTRKLFTYYNILAFLGMIFLYLPAIAVLIYGYLENIIEAFYAGLWTTIALVVIHIIILIWAKLYINSMVFIIDDEKVSSRKGVIIKSEDIAHYDKIQLVSVKQGIIERMLGIASVEINTAAVGLPSGEVKIRGLELNKANELRDVILEKLGMLTEERKKDVLLRMLEEIIKVRELLEKLIKEKE